MSSWNKITKANQISGLVDVSINSPNDGYVLMFDSALNKWVSKQIPNSLPINEVTMQSILVDIENPFKKTKIKCLGDSITNGDGATGFVSGGYNGWVKILNDWITSKYAGEEVIGLNHTGINITSNFSLQGYGTHMMPLAYRIDTPKDNDKGLEFSFYGDKFTIYYTGHTWGSIADVIVDGVKIGEIDTYSSPLVTQLSYQVNGLTLGYHNIKIAETSRKNPVVSTSTPALIFEAIKIPKTKTVFNAGNNGITTQSVYNAMKGTDNTKNITSEDDIILMMLGTNDRAYSPDMGKPKWFQTEMVKYALSLGCKIVLMSANPIPTSGENKQFKMHDVNMGIKRVAMNTGVPFISNYDAFNQHINNTGATLTSLLADGLHPNDLGYKVMANNIMRSLGLTVITDGVAL